MNHEKNQPMHEWSFDVARGLTESQKDSKPIHSIYLILVSVIISMLEKNPNLKKSSPVYKLFVGKTLTAWKQIAAAGL